MHTGNHIQQEGKLEDFIPYLAFNTSQVEYAAGTIFPHHEQGSGSTQPEC